MVPDGDLGHNLSGDVLDFTQDSSTHSYRAIIDIGLLDVEASHIKPKDTSLKIVGSSSDMMVIDLGENETKYKVGSQVEFDLDYMGILRLMSCDYVDKLVE